MKIYELIDKLEAIRNDYGDIEVVVDTEWAWAGPGLTIEKICLIGAELRTALVIR